MTDGIISREEEERIRALRHSVTPESGAATSARWPSWTGPGRTGS